jgi:hypothetical protein
LFENIHGPFIRGDIDPLFAAGQPFNEELQGKNGLAGSRFTSDENGSSFRKTTLEQLIKP